MCSCTTVYIYDKCGVQMQPAVRMCRPDSLEAVRGMRRVQSTPGVRPDRDSNSNCPRPQDGFERKQYSPRCAQAVLALLHTCVLQHRLACTHASPTAVLRRVHTPICACMHHTLITLSPPPNQHPFFPAEPHQHYLPHPPTTTTYPIPTPSAPISTHLPC